MPDQPKKVLVVDDEKDVVTYLSSLLHDSGLDVVTAHDGREGLTLAKQERPDLISLDIAMPGETGVRMLRDLHVDPDTQDIPVVIVTGIDPNFERFIRRQKQVPPPVAYFEKPIDKAAYVSAVKEALGEL